jgi:hypothetical protein
MNMYEFLRGINDSKVPHFKSIFFHNCLMGGVESVFDISLFCDYLIPTLVSELIERGEASCKVLSTTSVWHGVTYREDKPEVVASLAKLVEEGCYPKDRFGKK